MKSLACFTLRYAYFKLIPFRLIRYEMTAVADRDLPAVQITITFFFSWKHLSIA